MVNLSPDVRRLYPFQSRFLDMEGVRYHYLDEGRKDGEAVVMVHGNPTWSFYFRGLVQALGDRYRTIAPDHVGCGLSDRPRESAYPYTLARRVDDLERLLDHVGARDVTLVLHDWGGMIGLAYATRHPDRVKRLVLTNTSGFPMPAAKKLPLALKLARTPIAGSMLVRGLNAFSLGTVKTCVAKAPLPPAVARGYLSPYATWRDRLAVLRFVEDIPLDASHPSWDLVTSVERGLARLAEIPTLILWGARDFVFDDHFLDGFRGRMPHAEIHRFAGAGHLLFEDEPEKTFALVREFLGRPPSGAPRQ